MVPAVVIRPISFAESSVNQSAPSGPLAIEKGRLFAPGTVNSVMDPPVVIRPIRLPLKSSVNHMFSSGPTTMELGCDGVGVVDSANVPSVVTRPILWTEAANSVNQRAPSGPGAIELGSLSGVGTGNEFVIAPSVVRRVMCSSIVLIQSAPSGPAVIPSGEPGTGYSVIETACAAGTAAASITSATSIERGTSMFRDDPLR